MQINTPQQNNILTRDYKKRKKSIVIEVSDPMNIKIRVLEYRYGRLRYSDVILNVNVLPEDAPISITVHDTFAKIESD